MRKLTALQKKLLTRWMEEAEKKGDMLNTVDDLPFDKWNKLVEINDTEILPQEVDRFMWDKKFEIISGRPPWFN